jgi:hypothetical protein
MQVNLHSCHGLKDMGCERHHPGSFTYGIIITKVSQLLLLTAP